MTYKIWLEVEKHTWNDKLAKQVEQAEAYAVNSQIEVEETNNFLANAISTIAGIREERGE